MGNRFELGGSISDSREAVGGWFPGAVAQPPVGQVCGGLGESAEEWRAAYPSHGRTKGKAMSGSSSGCWGKTTPSVATEETETVGRTKAAVCASDLAEDAFKGTAELHGFGRG